MRPARSSAAPPIRGPRAALLRSGARACLFAPYSRRSPRSHRSPRPILLLIALLLPLSAAAQNPLLDALTPDSASDAPATAPAAVAGLAGIEAALAEARARLLALEELQEEPATGVRPPSAAREQATRLVRVLEQRREAQLQIDALALGREAIETGLARDPSEIVADPPPFPVPTLDGVLAAWRNAVQREEQHRSVLEDRRANLRLARERREDLDKERRRLREAVQRARDDVERIKLETEFRGLEGRLEIAGHQVALAEQRVESASIEHDLKRATTRQAEAALTWVESQLAPRQEDLTAALDRLERERNRIERSLEVARSRLADAEETLRTLESSGRPDGMAAGARYAAALETRRAQLAHRQQVVALLAQRVERLDAMRTSWQRRYAVLGGELDLERAPDWREATENELERLTRLRRIHEAELAEANRRRDTLLQETASARRDETGRLRIQEVQDLEELVSTYRADLVSLESAIELEERLRVELLARMRNRDFGERLESAWARVKAFWRYELTTSADSPITPGKIAIALTVFFVGLWASRAARGVLRGRVYPRFGFDAGASSAFASLTFYALLAAVFLFALRAVNIPLTAFAVAGGALAIGIGFGSQTIVSNFISGLLLLAERPIRTGDLIEIGGVVGTVDSIGLRSTRIQTPDNFHIIVPNASFLESHVVNWTHEDPMIRLRVTVGVAYGSPTREVERLLVQAAEEHPRTRPSPPPVAIFSEFGDSALLFEVRFWIRYDARTDRSAIRSDLRYRIDELFAEHGIVIAFPQMDVHLDVVGSAREDRAPRAPDGPSDADR